MCWHFINSSVWAELASDHPFPVSLHHPLEPSAILYCRLSVLIPFTHTLWPSGFHFISFDKVKPPYSLGPSRFYILLICHFLKQREWTSLHLSNFRFLYKYKWTCIHTYRYLFLCSLPTIDQSENIWTKLASVMTMYVFFLFVLSERDQYNTILHNFKYYESF